jgi:hypothetical protein
MKQTEDMQQEAIDIGTSVLVEMPKRISVQ